jgi:2-dehydro-3-deoxyphosphogluconate aldolase/(4S)-4-hydroxy-2-oxoglutarate aldolase
MPQDAVFTRIRELAIIPAIRCSLPYEALRAAEAIASGGVPAVEVSLAVPGALDALEAVAKVHDPHVLPGAGSVVAADDVRRAVAAGARFIVTPGFSLETVNAARELEVAIFAGALTPTEVQDAMASGADAVKLFPCSFMGGAPYLRLLQLQFPHAAFIASGGVTLENCPDYIRAGACALGIGAEIADHESIAAAAYGVLTVRTKRFHEAVLAARLIWSEPEYSLNVDEAR